MEVSIIINLASSQEQIIYWMVSRSDVPILTTGHNKSQIWCLVCLINTDTDKYVSSGPGCARVINGLKL